MLKNYREAFQYSNNILEIRARFFFLKHAAKRFQALLRRFADYAI